MRTILFMIALALLFDSCSSIGPQGPPVATRGELDLSAYSWSEGPVDLRGEWTFDGEPQQVPEALRFAGSPHGSGTYRLTVRLDPGAPTLALRLPIVGTAFELRAEGTLRAGEGRVSASADGAVPAYRPRIVLLPVPADGVLDLEVRISNWNDQFAGLYEVPVLGPWDQVLAERERSMLWEALVFGALFFLGLYHCGSFVFRTRNQAPFWFGLFCLLVAARSTFYSEVLFLQAFPEASWFLVIRGVYATMSLALAAFALFLARLYPVETWKLSTRVAVTAGVGYAVLNLAAPVEWTLFLLVPFQAVLVAYGLSALSTLIRALGQREPGAGLFVGGMAVFLVTVILDIAKSHWFWNLPSMVNVGSLVFVLMQSLVVARLFANAFQDAENHSRVMDQINTSLERFIPREILGFLGKRSITEIDLGDFSERKMTVFFLDIRDFTGLSESMTPRENFRFINSFLRLFGPLVRDHNGFVDKYLGDGIMALFPGSPDEALAAAGAMRRALVEYNEGRERGGYRPVRFGIGIHTGVLMLGTIGENRRMDSTVISDTVNAASRLEGLTKKYSTDILVSGETVEALTEPARFGTEFLASETVKGRRRPIEVYRLAEATSGV